MRNVSQNKLMTDYTIGPGGSLNSLDIYNFNILEYLGMVWACSLIIVAPPHFMNWGAKWPEGDNENKLPCTLPQVIN